MGDGKTVKKLKASAFRQQRLKSWQPILTPKTVLPTFFTIGALFIPLGIGLFIASDRVSQLSFDYSTCKNLASSSFSIPNPPIPPIQQWKYDPASRNCTVQFSVDKDFLPPVFLYYRLTNFYQNLRRYADNFDARQIKGYQIGGPNDPDLGSAEAKKELADCYPLRLAGPGVVFNNVSIDENAQIYPCGLIANSLFTDEIFNPQCTSASCSPTSTYTFHQENISWPSDKQKFGTTKWLTNNPSLIPTKLVPPPQWRDPSAFGGKWVNGYTAENLPDLAKWEKLQVWMRTAGLPNFRKLWGRNDDEQLKKGVWEIVVQDNFNVTNYSGSKSIVISTISILGGKNPFLGIAYISIGFLCILMGVIFLIRHMVKPRKLGDHTYLSWNQPVKEN